jgi:hypothetical protein
LKAQFDIVIDCLGPTELARFWQAALPAYAIRPYDAAEIDRLAALGLTPETDPSVALDGPGPTLWFQLRDPCGEQQGRLHLDLPSSARPAEVRRLCGLGAVLRIEREDHSVLADPEGNRFCVVDI